MIEAAPDAVMRCPRFPLSDPIATGVVTSRNNSRIASTSVSSPRRVPVECHATGTRRGDETEVLAMRELFRDVTTPVAIGSLKGNLGHLITASGAASIIKILGGFESGTLPPTLHADAPLEALTGAPLRL